MSQQTTGGGTGGRLGDVVIILAGVAALAATLLTTLSVWLQTKNYRKPLLQRYVVRILLMVPIYSAASWTSLVSLKAAFWIDPLRDIYEGFTIYAFFQLLINFIGGERALLIMMHGRQPISHPWPLSRFFSKVDISDPHTFLAVKRGILQYIWLKPVLALATIIMRATGTFHEGKIAVRSGYFWSGLVYNLSITVCLYSLAMFWVCMLVDLKPFRPMPKFLCIKGIIFASYWQGFLLSILVKLSIISDQAENDSSQSLAASIQDALICFEMPIFAVLHWYAFSWHDYADDTISAARMPVKFALRDSFGPQDLIQDARETFAGKQYEYRFFDAEDDVLAHEESGQRVARMMQGMRYGRSGKGKYWIPKPGQADSATPLLQSSSDEETGSSSALGDDHRSSHQYGATVRDDSIDFLFDLQDEQLFTNARSLEFGDWNYPVITAHHATRDNTLYNKPSVITPSTNRNILQPTPANRDLRKHKINKMRQSTKQGKRRHSSTDRNQPSGTQPSSESAATSEETASDQVVDLVVEDHDAEEAERVRDRKLGNPRMDQEENKHFVELLPEDRQGEHIQKHIRDRTSYDSGQNTAETEHWQWRDYSDRGQSPSTQLDPECEDNANIWLSQHD